MQFYYYQGTERKGPINQAQLKALAMSGIIVGQTVIETDAGKRFLASTIKGLEFKKEQPPNTEMPDSRTKQVSLPVPQMPNNPSDQSSQSPPALPALQETSPSTATPPVSGKKTKSFGLAQRMAFVFLILGLLLFFNGSSMTKEEKKALTTGKDKIEYYHSNKYVGGDAYNYIINGTYFTGYNVIALRYTILKGTSYICSALFLSTSALLFFMPRRN